MSNNTNINVKTKDIVISGLLIALVCVATYFGFNPTATQGGYAHLGNVMLFPIAIMFGKRKGAIAGAFGMGLFDVLSSYTVWAPFTFIIRGIMGYIIGSFAWSKDRRGKSIFWNTVGIVISSLIMIIGYFIAEVILLKFGLAPLPEELPKWLDAIKINIYFISPLISLPGNLIQIAIGLVAGLPIARLLINNKFVNDIK